MPRPTPPPSLPPIDRQAAEARRLQLHRELAPAGVLQALLVDQIARATTRLGLAAEWEMLVEPGDPAWTRYQQQAERTLHRSMLELRRLSKEAKATAGAAPSTPAIFPARSAPAPLPRSHARRGTDSPEAPPLPRTLPAPGLAPSETRATRCVGEAIPCRRGERGALDGSPRGNTSGSSSVVGQFDP